jgi:hypothetical protein
MQAWHLNKFSNAFIPNAVPSEVVGGAALKELNRRLKKTGGLWVGGKIIASADGIRFEPNGMNIALHEGLKSVHIPFSEIISVRRKFGWVTGIVVVQHQHGEFRFRCFGAKKVATTLASRVSTS